LCESSLDNEYFSAEVKKESEFIKLTNYYRVADDAIDLAPSYQELHIFDRVFRFDMKSYEVIDASIIDGNIFLLCFGNYGYQISRLCNDGGVEFVCDYIEIDLNEARSIDVVIDGPEIRFTVKYGCYGDDCTQKSFVKTVFNGLAFSGCKKITHIE
jgi:hypothetical protein